MASAEKAFTPRGIIYSWLQRHRYGGMCGTLDGAPCWCTLEDLAPCWEAGGGGSDGRGCVPGYRTPCNVPSHTSACKWHIVIDKSLAVTG
jgi:hypothetical protein